ncbi:MAG: YggU family protein [Chlamydiales bacterium]|nr:YggU family protein [Chlamydiia bacterium]MCP5506867.1 YggU family protein [Chlamydiales bacterium]
MVWKETKDGILITVKIIPKAQFPAIVGWSEGQLRVRIAAVPEKGKANAALIAFLAKELGLSKSAVVLVSGQTSRLKQVLIKDHSIISHPLFKEK